MSYVLVPLIVLALYAKRTVAATGRIRASVRIERSVESGPIATRLAIRLPPGDEEPDEWMIDAAKKVLAASESYSDRFYRFG